MSRSPDEAPGDLADPAQDARSPASSGPAGSPASAESSVADYRRAWQTVSRWMQQGISWSGRERNSAFLNVHDGTFADASYVTGLDLIDDGRGLAMVDWDHDGDLDMWLTNRTSPMVRFLRNDGDNQYNYVQLELQGTASNRDAIGARVEIYVDEAGPPLIQTLRGGEGFLSQPSKCLHFGLGQATSVHHVVIRWPQGKSQTFHLPQINTRYLVTEGSPDCLVRARRAAIGPLEPSDPRPPAPTELTAHALPAPYPLATRTYQDFAGVEQHLASRNSLVLVNLWASWCVPCVQELHEFQSAEATLRGAGVEVVALALDGVGKDQTDLAAAPALLKKLGFTGRSGRATAELLEFFQGVNDDLLGYQRALPVPSSFLLDRAGRLLAFYKGPVPVDRVVADAARQGQRYAELLTSVMPLADGIWQSPPESIRASVYAELAVKAREAGETEQAIELFEMAAAELPRSVAAQVDLANELWRLRRPDKAREAAQRALALDGKHVGALRALANMQLASGDLDGAAGLLERLLAERPHDAPSLDQLGVISVQRGNKQRAGELFAQAVQADPNVARYHHNLARFLEDQAAWQRAIQEYQTAYQLDDQAIDTLQQLAWILAVVPDDQLRDPPRAVQLAQRLTVERRVREPRALDVLAAALANAGDFDQATQVIQQAIRVASQRGDRKLATQMQNRLRLYEQRQPFRLNSTNAAIELPSS